MKASIIMSLVVGLVAALMAGTGGTSLAKGIIVQRGANLAQGVIINRAVPLAQGVIIQRRL